MKVYWGSWVLFGFYFYFSPFIWLVCFAYTYDFDVCGLFLRDIWCWVISIGIVFLGFFFPYSPSFLLSFYLLLLFSSFSCSTAIMHASLSVCQYINAYLVLEERRKGSVIIVELYKNHHGGVLWLLHVMTIPFLF